MTTRRLTVYLLQKGVVEFDDAVDSSKTPIKLVVKSSFGVPGVFYYQPSFKRPPAWVEFVDTVLEDNLENVFGASSSGLLMLRLEGRIFAFTFGYGRSLLNLSLIEPQFGMKVVLNMIDPKRIRSIDTKSFQDFVVSTNTQVSKNAELPAFGVDISKDIVRGVAGEPEDQGFAKRMAGSDSLVIGYRESIDKLPDFCMRLLSEYIAEKYKKTFGWIDQLAIVQDKNLIDSLNEKVAKQLRDRNLLGLHLAMPEQISFEDFSGFKIEGTGRHLYDDLNLEDYVDKLGDQISKITVATLNSRHVNVVFSRSGQSDKRWTLYRCIVSEQRFNNALYVLIEGTWFVVSSSLVEEVDNFLLHMPHSCIKFPPALCGETEPIYNERFANIDTASYLKMDAKILRPDGASSGIEFCDVFSKNGDLIHIKRKSCSATLSHLFSQGNVSAITLLNDESFRKKLRVKIQEVAGKTQAKPWLDIVAPEGEPVRREKFRVVYAVITNSNGDGYDWLPFFSKLNLMQQGKQLISMGMHVSVAKIPVQSK